MASVIPYSDESLDPSTFGSYRKILLLAGPLILSHMGVMVMQVVDGLFLARYSKSAIAAIGPSGMTFWLLCGFFIGIAGYTNTFVAQYMGAKRSDRVGVAVWQGIYLSLVAGAILFVANFSAGAVFRLVGHAPDIQANEAAYFRTLCYGGPAFMLSAALSGFYAGRNDNLPLMIAHVAGNIVNAVLAWALVFGRLGLPEKGMEGAAMAAVLGQLTQVLLLGLIFLKPKHQREFRTWQDRALDMPLLWRMCQFGFPNGVRMVIEILAWAAFLLLLGRVDSDGLAASNIVWRINGMAFFPAIGLSVAISMLVGQAQGAGRPELVRRVTKRGLVLTQVWMASAALAMVLMPNLLLSIFMEQGSQTDLQLRDLSVHLLRFVATYCLLDGVNIVLMSVLTGAGDTRWMLLASGGVHAGFIGLLVFLAMMHAGVYAFWATATVFICSATLVWTIRFRSGKWQDKRVIEHTPLDIETMPIPGA